MAPVATHLSATSLLWAALTVQAVWLLLNSLAWHRTPGIDLIGAAVVVSVAGFAVLGRRWRWTAVPVRLVMATEFLLAVADRFGLLGPPGASGVSWGNFSRCIDHTHKVAAFLPTGLAPTLAVGATLAEIILGTALLLGVRVRLAATGSAGLLAIYGICMTISLPVAEQFHYNVFLLCAAMLALAKLDPTSLSLDNWLAQRRGSGPATRRAL
jgi:uncharacterized membrane protein YphA (DoxX/SURF4 family)